MRHYHVILLDSQTNERQEAVTTDIHWACDKLAYALYLYSKWTHAKIHACDNPECDKKMRELSPVLRTTFGTSRWNAEYASKT